MCVCVPITATTQLVSEFCRLDLTCPVPGCDPQEVRTLLLEGMLRLRDNSAKVRACDATCWDAAAVHHSGTAQYSLI